jgi:glyoxylase-like metal-dependent hydrolase (beta-lactamase superfamily II)
VTAERQSSSGVGGNVRVICIEVGLLACNAYLVLDEAAGAGAVIDPGAEGGRIVRRCHREGLAPAYIINTHGHADHIGANAELKAAFPAALLCIGERDAGRLVDSAANLTAMLGMSAASPRADRLLAEGQELRFGSVAFKVLETPGHTPGGICLVVEDASPPQLFCGDLIFRDGVGRCDLPGGNEAELVESIRRKVMRLPDETVLWPGHGPKTTVGWERQGSPFLGSGNVTDQ